MMVEDGNLEVLKLLSSTSSKIAQGEVLQLQHKGEVDMLEETYFKIITDTSHGDRAYLRLQRRRTRPGFQ